MKIYDIENKQRDDILIEQVDGNFDSYRLYDASFVQFEEFIYYYKRIRSADKKSQLLLYKYDLKNFKEEKMADTYAIQEKDEIQFNLIFGEKFGTKSRY